MTTRSFLLRLANVVAAVLVGAACVSQSPQRAEATPPSKEEFVVAVSALGNEALDPILSPGDNSIYLGVLFDRLVGMNLGDAGLSTKWGLAERWDISADSKTYTFFIRKGVKFHNGDELTAEDVKFSIERLKSPDAATPDASSITGPIQSIVVKGPYELQITLKDPSVSWIYLFAQGVGGMVVPKSYIEKVGVAEFRLHPVGTGPYKFAGRQAGAFITYEAVDGHFAAGNPRFKKLTIRLVPEETTRIAMLRRGEADLIDVGREQADVLKGAGFKVATKPLDDTVALYFQLWRGTQTIFHDIRIRKALSLAINREEINKFLLHGFGKVKGNVLAEGAIGYKPLTADEYDPQKARQLLQEAGVKPGELNIQFQAFPRAGWPENLAMAGAVISYWSAIGVNAQLTYRDYGSYRSEWRGGKLPEPAVTLAEFGGTRFNLSFFRTLMSCAGELRTNCDPELDKMIDALGKTATNEQYASGEAAIDAYLRTNYEAIPLVGAGPVYVGDKFVPDDYTPGMGIQDANFRMVVSER